MFGRHLIFTYLNPASFNKVLFLCLFFALKKLIEPERVYPCTHLEYTARVHL